MGGAPPVDPVPGFGAPLPLATLIGREREVAALRTLLGGDARLVTLTGPGGVGKTHLALHVANEVADQFPDGTLFVPLAAVRDPGHVLSEIAQALAIAAGDEPLFERLRQSLHQARVLLVLDNAEHLLPAAPDLARLLEICRGPKALVTSRAPLRVSGEHVVPVEPLPLPDLTTSPSPAALRANPAVALFLARAGGAGADRAALEDQLETIARICRRLDGLPLAIELAAAPDLLALLERRLPLLTDGPRNAPQRLQTMRDAIAWSFDLLDPTQQALFRRLAVFDGGFTRDAAAALVRGWTAADGYPFAGTWERGVQPWWVEFGTEPPADSWRAPELPPLEVDLVAGLGALVGQSLLRPVRASVDSSRYEMLETIREYGLEQLEASGEAAAVRHAHAAYFLALAEASGIRLWQAAVRREWLTRLEAELGNVRAALRWWAEQGEAANQVSLRMTESLGPFWQTRGNPGEGRGWLEAALAWDSGTPTARASALNVAGLLAWFQGDDEHATRRLEESLAISRSIEYGVGAGRALFFLSLVARLFGAARALSERVGAFLPPTEDARYERLANEVRSALGDAAFAAAFTAGLAMPPEQAVAEAQALAAAILGEPPPRPAKRRPPAAPPMEDAVLPPLTELHLEVIRLLAQGNTPKEIAVALGRRKSTIYDHLKRIRRTLGVHTNAEIVANAVRHGLV